MFKLSLLILALPVLGFLVLSVYCGYAEAWKMTKLTYKNWFGRNKSSLLDRLRKLLFCALVALMVPCAQAKLFNSQEVVGPHNELYTPVPESQVPPVIVKMYTGYTGPTSTPTPTFTWNATTTRTQPPTATPTATNTPIMVSGEVRYTRFSDHPTPSSNLIIPAASPTAIVYAATTPGYHHKIEVCSQNIGTAAGLLTAGGMTYDFAPYTPWTLFLFSVANGAVTIDTSYVAGVTIRANIFHAIVKDGF